MKIEDMPKDHTLIGYGIPKEGGWKWSKIYYAKYPKFDYLPGVAKSDETKKEYDEFWEWYRENVTEYTKYLSQKQSDENL